MAQEKQSVWHFRRNLEDKVTDIAVQNAKTNAHIENIYHHIKRIESHLQKQNGSIAEHDSTINRWKGIALGFVIVFSFVQILVAMIIH
jgi:adenylosuccinate lyase